MTKADYKSERVCLARWIANYILPVGVDSPRIEGQGMIQKAMLKFAAKF